MAKNPQKHVPHFPSAEIDTMPQITVLLMFLQDKEEFTNLIISSSIGSSSVWFLGFQQERLESLGLNTREILGILVIWSE